MVAWLFRAVVGVLAVVPAHEGEAAGLRAADVPDAAGGYSDCVPSAPQIAFDHGYTVSMCIERAVDGELVQTDAFDYGLDSSKSGLLYFFERENVEVLVKVLDGCAENGHRWVFVAPVTTLAFNLQIEETATGKRWTHRNPRGGATARTASDLTAFPCGSAAASTATAESAPSVLDGGGREGRSAIQPPGGGGGAEAGSLATCQALPVATLRGDFTVNMCAEDGNGGVFQVKDYGLDSDRSALLYLFERDNAEVLVKVLDGCGINGHRWVFVAPVTTLAFNLSITPPAGGRPWTHQNLSGRTADAKSDLTAFPCSASSGEGAFSGQVTGFQGDYANVEVLLTARGVLRVVRPDAFGWFKFDGLADGQYAVKVQAPGHRVTPARLIQIPDLEDRNEPFDLTPIPTSPFVFHWEEDQSTAGTEYAAAINEPLEVEVGDVVGTVADSSAATILANEFNVQLVDTLELAWSQEHAWRMLTTMQTIPQHVERGGPPSRWRLTSRFLRNDIQIERIGGGANVLVSEAAFVNARQRIATVEGKRGVWYSKRLHHALVRFVTDGGRDVGAYERIFLDRYGVETRVEDYRALTWPTGNEGYGRFQQFHAEEILTILNMLEEFPSGMHKTQGLRKLIRRRNGTEHPLYPEAPAVAWPDAGYVEFMESAFTVNDVEHMQRLVIHEKAHFLWAHVLDQKTRDDWTRLGGWYKDRESPSGWSTTKQTEFVSAYSHQKNPNEDMAETISFFIINPDKLRSRSLAKYEFVRDRIMQGNLYVSRIREDLTFTVYNLFPDYVFPGKVRRVDIRVDGAPREDKTLRVEIELHALDRVLEGAAEALTRLTSSVGTYFDMRLYPVDAAGRRRDGVGTVLVGTAPLNRHMKAGYWTPNQLIIKDNAGNQRLQRGGDFGWKLYLDNPLEDWNPPEYVPGTARLEHGHGVVRGVSVPTVVATWGVAESSMATHQNACNAHLTNELENTYSLQRWGPFDFDARLCGVTFAMPDYMPSSKYELEFIRMFDQAQNVGRVEFGAGLGRERRPGIRVTTPNPDTEPPELDLNRIAVSAEPSNPEAPNGETYVTVTFHVRDNISGFTDALLSFRDPQGGRYAARVYDEHRDSIYPPEDPTRWKEHTFVHVLPAGSAPGVWGISDMTLGDRAANFVFEDFTETIRFEVQ